MKVMKKKFSEKDLNFVQTYLRRLFGSHSYDCFFNEDGNGICIVSTENIFTRAFCIGIQTLSHNMGFTFCFDSYDSDIFTVECVLFYN